MLQYLYNFFYYEVLYYLREMLVAAVGLYFQRKDRPRRAAKEECL